MENVDSRSDHDGDVEVVDHVMNNHHCCNHIDGEEEKSPVELFHNLGYFHHSDSCHSVYPHMMDYDHRNSHTHLL